MTDLSTLLPRLTDDDPQVRLQAVLEAGQPADGPASPALVEALVRRLHDPHPGVAQAALETLTLLIDAQRATVPAAALERALELAEHDSALVRAEAVGALGVFCPEVASPPRVERLLAALDDREPRVRRVAIAAVGDLGLEAAREKLEAALADRDLRLEAAFALASLGSPAAREPLEAALASKSSRLDALEGLRRLAEPAAAPAVRTLAEGWLTPWIDRLSAWATLHVLGAADAGARLAERVQSRRMEERVYALFLIGQHRVAAGRAAVEQVARDRKHRERETALEALGRFDDAEAASALLAVAEADDESVDARVAAARAVAGMATEAAVAGRARLRRDPDPQVRAAAAPGSGITG